MTALNAYYIATSQPVAYEIVPRLRSGPSAEGNDNVPDASRAGAGFDHLIAMRGRNGYDGAAMAQGRSPSHCQAATHDLTSLEVGVAKSREQLAAADSLIENRYAWRGYKVQSSERVEQPEQQEDPSHRVTFFARVNQKVVGTITLRLDGPAGLRADATHGDIVQYARAESRRLGELTRLALAAHVDSRRVLSSLFGLVYSIGRWEHNVTDVFVEVNPRHVAFYVRALGFAIVGDAKFCERVGAPSILLYADVEALEERLGLDVPSWPEESAQRRSA